MPIYKWFWLNGIKRRFLLQTSKYAFNIRTDGIFCLRRKRANLCHPDCTKYVICFEFRMQVYSFVNVSLLHHKLSQGIRERPNSKSQAIWEHSSSRNRESVKVILKSSLQFNFWLQMSLHQMNIGIYGMQCALIGGLLFLLMTHCWDLGSVL